VKTRRYSQNVLRKQKKPYGIGKAATLTEINFEAPGRCWLDLERSKFEGNLLVSPVFAYDEQALATAELIKQIMVDTETEFFAAAGSPIIGRAEYAIAPYWKH
jgi:hypothetical protein